AHSLVEVVGRLHVVEVAAVGVGCERWRGRAGGGRGGGGGRASRRHRQGVGGRAGRAGVRLEGAPAANISAEDGGERAVVSRVVEHHEPVAHVGRVAAGHADAEGATQRRAAQEVDRVEVYTRSQPADVHVGG